MAQIGYCIFVIGAFLAGVFIGAVGMFLTFKDTDMISALESENRILQAENEELKEELLEEPKKKEELKYGRF